MTDILEDYVRVSEILAIFQAYAHVDRKVLKKAQDVGTLIHQAIESYFKDEFIPLDARKASYFESFLRWADVVHPIPVAAENRLYDPELMITGQFDLVATIDGEPYIIDFKTGSWEHPEIWEMQMTFYRHLISINGMHIPDRFMIVQLDKTGHEPKLFDYRYSEKTWETCLAAMSCYKFFNPGCCIKLAADIR